MEEKIGDYFLDISKLVFVGVVLSAVLEVEGISKIAVLTSGIVATTIFALIGFVLIRKQFME